MPHPVHQRLDAIGPDVAVEAVELGRAGDAEAVGAEPAGHDLGGFIEQADGGRGVAGCAAHRAAR